MAAAASIEALGACTYHSGLGSSSGAGATGLRTSSTGNVTEHIRVAAGRNSLAGSWGIRFGSRWTRREASSTCGMDGLQLCGDHGGSAFKGLSDRHPAEEFTQTRRGRLTIVSAAVMAGKQVERAFLQDNVGPNAVVLEAQARVCTGPKQTRPLTEESARDVLLTIVRSVNGELEESEKVSAAQLGAFFGAMTLRTTFPPSTQWSDGEREVLTEMWPTLCQILPADVLFLADPEGAIFGGLPPVGPTFTGNGVAEMRLVGALREVLAGGHLGFEEVVGLLRDILPLRGSEGMVRDSLVAAFLIAQRMNTETERELKAYCMAFDDELGTLPTANVHSLTHYGEPYDGNTRFFRSTLFVAAVRASYGEACVLHGVDWMPPKGGVTEEQILKHLGAATTLDPEAAVRLLEDREVGFAFLSQREVRPSLYSLRDLRRHIKKRPPLATTEKIQQFIRGVDREAIMAGFYHEGYEEPLLMLIRRRGVDAGLVIKGEEGGLSLTTKGRSPDAAIKGRPVNFCAGFRPSTDPNVKEDMDGVLRETFGLELHAEDYGFQSTPTPRVDKSVVKNVELGLDALKGEKGPAYDRIVFNAAMADHLLHCRGADDIPTAIARAQEAIDSGRALEHLMNYVARSHLVA